MRNLSQSHDLLDEEVFLELSNIGSEEKGTFLHTLPPMDAAIEAALDNDDFIEAKDTQKSWKKAAKNKAVSLPNNSAVVSVSGSTTEQTKATHQIQQNKDLLPSPPSAPSLGDFLFWKGDQASAITSPAWSTDSIKFQKPRNLRDIFKEQDKKKMKSGQQQTPMPTPTKVQQTGKAGGGSSSSPSKVSPLINSSTSASTRSSSHGLGQHKTIVEDDFFWGSPLKQSKEGSR